MENYIGLTELLDTGQKMRDTRCGSNHGRFDPDKPTWWRRIYREYLMCDAKYGCEIPDMRCQIWVPDILFQNRETSTERREPRNATFCWKFCLLIREGELVKSESDFVKKILDGDLNAFRNLVEQYQNLVMHVVFRDRKASCRERV